MKNTPYKGKLIVIEGIDGSGKSSLAKSLQKKLEEKNHKTILTKEPGGSILGQKLRYILHEKKEHTCDKAEFLLFAADRSQHFEQIVIPALEEGKIVISDRSAYSSLAYQGYGRGLDIEMIKKINEWAMQGLEPDIIFYIDIDFETARPRITKRGEKLTSFESEKETFFKKVIAGFEKIFENKKNVIKLNGKNSIELLTEQAIKHILTH